MTFLGSVYAWFADPAHWQGNDGIPVRMLEHVQLTAVSVGVAALIALPLGLYLGHTGRLAFLAINVANIGRALPSFAVLALAFMAFLIAVPPLAFGFWPAAVAMLALALPPILTNTFVAIRTAEPDTVEAARGMGMGELQVLRAVELPEGLPIILAGLRTATVHVIATATLAAVVAGPALGRYIIDGIALQEFERVFAGALLVALLALGTEGMFTVLERVTRHTGGGRRP